LKDTANSDDITRVSLVIFEIASTNRFFSKMYAELYADLIGKYDILRFVFEDSLSRFMDLFDTIEYVESTVDYDMFCKNNKDNERRKSLSAFFVNLMINNIISKDIIIDLTRNLLVQFKLYIVAENIGILYKKSLYDGMTYELIDGMTINETIQSIASSKIKDYKSLTNKAVFKFMDLIDM
jgi:hypothetical protein